MISKTYNPSFLLPHYPPFKLRQDQQTMYNLYSTTTTRNEEFVSIFQSKDTWHTKPSTSAPPNNDLNQGTDEDEDPRLSNRYSNINESYQSEALEKNITDTLKSFSVPHSHQSQTQLQTQDYQQTQAQKQQLNNPSLALFRWQILQKRYLVLPLSSAFHPLFHNQHPG